MGVAGHVSGCVGVEAKEVRSYLDWPVLSGFFLIPVEVTGHTICVLSPCPPLHRDGVR